MAEYFEAGVFNILDEETDTYHKMLAIKGEKGDPGPVASEEEIRRVTSEEVAKVVAEAPEDFDTLKEIADWIATHKDDASAMNSAILENARQISMLQDDRDDINDNIDTNINPRISKNATEIANTKPNLIPFPYTTNNGAVSNGVTFNAGFDGKITLNGNNSGVQSYWHLGNKNFTLEKGKTYTIVTDSDKVGTYIYCGVYTYAKGSSTLIHNYTIPSTLKSLTFTVADNDEDFIVWVRVKENKNMINYKLSLMLVEGETAPTEYKMFGNMTCVGTLASGETTLELASDKITTSSMIEPPYFYITDGSEVEPISYNTVKVENGKVTYTFDAMDTDLLVGIRVI